MRDGFRQIGALVLAVVLVTMTATSGLGGPISPTGTASAEWSEECNIGQSLLGAAYNTIIGSDSGCRWESGSQTDWENVTATQTYASGLSLGDATESYTTTTGNFLENSRTIASSKAKINVINSLNNGSAEAVADGRVNTTIRDYYARIQLEVITDWNAKVTQIEYMNESSSGVVYMDDEGSDAIRDTAPIGSFGTETITLVNGTTVTARTIVAGDYTDEIDGGTRLGEGVMKLSGSTERGDPTTWHISVSDPDTGTDTIIVTDDDYISLISGSESQSAQVVDNFDAYVSGVYAEYEAGEINSTTLAMNDPSVIAAEASTSYNSTGYYSYAAIQLAAIGAQGDLNVSHSVDVYANASATSPTHSWNGTLMYTGDDAPDGWTTGNRYAVSDYNGTFYYVVSPSDANKSAYVVDLSQQGEEFTLTSATNTQTGESVNTTQTQKFVYETANASALAEEIDRLEELRDQYENANAGGSGGIGFDLGGTQTGFVLALVLVVVLMVRS